MKKMLLIMMLVLSSCSFGVQKFDSLEYSNIAKAEATLSPKICSSSEMAMKAKIDDFNSQIDFLRTYESGLPNNTNIMNMLNGVSDETNRFSNLVNSYPSISSDYCNKKIDSLRRAISTVLTAEGNRPR
jgi:hypothetical protein